MLQLNAPKVTLPGNVASFCSGETDMVDESFEWMSDEDINKFYSFCDFYVRHSKLQGTFRGNDIAVKIMMENHGKSLEEHKDLVPKALNLEYKKEKDDTHEVEWTDHQSMLAKGNTEWKIIEDEAYYKKNKLDKSKWETKQRMDKTDWWKAKNLKQKLKARKKARIQRKVVVIAKKLAKKMKRIKLFEKKNGDEKEENL